jgi:biopolymer transport protein ExbB
MFQEYIIKGGVEWMLPLLILSFIALALTLERGFFWFCFFLKRRRYFKELKKITQTPFNFQEALFLSKNASHPLIKSVFIFLHGLQYSQKEQATTLALHEIQKQVNHSRTGVDVLVFIANVSGTLGLLGTVVGVAMAMESLGLNDPLKLTHALSVALYTTIAGVILFIFTSLSVFLFNKFSNALEFQLQEDLNNLKLFTQSLQSQHTLTLANTL